MSTAENSKGKNQEQTIRPPEVPEIDRLKLYNLVLQQRVCQEQLNNLVLQFLQIQQPRAVQERIEDLTKQINNMSEKIFADANVDARSYRFNIEQGIFVERSADHQRGD